MEVVAVSPPVLLPLEDPAFAALFWDLCEFAAADVAVPGWFRLPSSEPLEVVGRDASGGLFCLYGGPGDGAGSLLYVSSEGEAGVIAGSLAEGLQMMIALPHWRDCLKFSGGGRLEEMRKAQRVLPPRALGKITLFPPGTPTESPDLHPAPTRLYILAWLVPSREAGAPSLAYDMGYRAPRPVSHPSLCRQK